MDRQYIRIEHEESNDSFSVECKGNTDAIGTLFSGLCLHLYISGMPIELMQSIVKGIPNLARRCSDE